MHVLLSPADTCQLCLVSLETGRTTYTISQGGRANNVCFSYLRPEARASYFITLDDKGDIEVSIKTVLLISLVGCIIAAPALATEDCADEVAAKANVESLDGDIVQLRDQRKVQEAATQAQINDAATALVKSGRWTEQDRSGFFASQLKSEEFLAAEKQKKSQLALFGLAAQTMVSYRGKGNFKEACISANSMRELFAKVGTINDAQYKKMLIDIQAVAPPSP